MLMNENLCLIPILCQIDRSLHKGFPCHLFNILINMFFHALIFAKNRGRRSPRDLANVNAVKTHVGSSLHKFNIIKLDTIFRLHHITLLIPSRTVHFIKFSFNTMVS